MKEIFLKGAKRRCWVLRRYILVPVHIKTRLLITEFEILEKQLDDVAADNARINITAKLMLLFLL